jgi:hypothetical protein
MKGISTRVTAAITFTAAGVFSILGDVERWWPACARGSFDSAECSTLQDFLYDSMVPQAPWIQTGNAAEFIGVSYLLLSVALVLSVPLAMAPRRVALPLGLLATSAFAVGASSLWAGLTNTAAPEPLGYYILLSYLLGGMLLLAWAWCADTLPTRWKAVRSHLFYLSIFLTTIPLYGFASMVVGYQSHDRTPWDGAVAGVLFILAGLVCLMPAQDRTDPTETFVKWESAVDVNVKEDGR